MGWSCASTTVRRLVRVSRRGRRVERSRCKDGVLARRLRLLGGWVRVGVGVGGGVHIYFSACLV